MTVPAELARQYTGLDAPARLHLERLMANWGLLADLSFSDLALYVPLDEHSLAVAEGADERSSLPSGLRGLHFVAFGQMRPTTSQTLFPSDLVGHIVSAEELPLVAEAWSRATIVAGELHLEEFEGTARVECIPVRWQHEVVGVLQRVWSPTAGRRTGGLERVYLRLFERLATMVSAGIYPFRTEDEVVEGGPRVGDGVIVLDAEGGITFASPNAVNALHRLGIVSAIVGSRFASVGSETETVIAAMHDGRPSVAEIDRRGEVAISIRCIPLIEGDLVSGAAVLVRDVTDLRRRDRLLLSKDAAIREVHHRVKNNLQTISSLLRLQSRRLEDETAKEALIEAERRIQAIALVHEILARSPGEQVHFDEIVPALVQLAHHANVGPKEVAVHVGGDIGDLSADVATPLAVVIAELLQNAVEHAFKLPGVAAPVVELTFANDGKVLDVAVRDNGAGFAAGFDIDRTRSLGLAIVRDLIRSQLGGTITVENENGAFVHLVIPL